MKAYITLEEAKKHLNIDGCFNDDNQYIEELAETALCVVERDICRSLKHWEDADGGLFKPLKHAALLLLSHYYANREPVAFANSSKVPETYDALIDRFRDWEG